MLDYICLVAYQYTTLIVLSALALTLIIVCAVLSGKLFGNKIVRKANKQIAFMNLDEEEETVEGISILAKRKYLVSSENKVKPQVYTLLITEPTVICVNHINREFKQGDTIELCNGDTICSLKDNVVLAA